MAIYTDGDVRVADYAPLRNRGAGRNAVKALKDKSAVILANHGVITVGRALDEALEILTVVERAAQVYVLSKLPR